MTTGGRFDFDDGGTYCGGWEDGKAHGYGVCTGPKGQGEYAGAWHCGYEISGIYTWSSGNNYRGQWTQGKRHGLGVETKGRWVYRGEWTQGFKGRYGVRQSTTTGATYEGTWTTGLQDGYGVETYADGGTYQGQWLRGIRHGYGVRQSVPYGLAAHNRQKSAIRESLTSLRSEQEDDQVVKDRDRKIDEGRGGFVLRGPGMPPMNSTDSLKRHGGASSVIEKSSGRSSLRKTIVDGLRLRKQRSTGDIQESTQMRIGGSRPGGGGSVRSTVSSTSRASSVESSQSVMTGVSVHTDSNASFISQDDVADLNMVEIYSGEWKNDKRSGFGVVERSDGLKYEGEWEGNKKHGYGATTFRDGTREEGKYKNNVLTTSGRRSKLFILRANKLKDRVENAVAAANRAAQIAQQKSDIAISRMASARAKAEQAQQSATKAQTDAEKARQKATSYDPNFIQPGVDIMRKAQEQAQIQLQQQQQKSNPAMIGNHTGSSSTSTLDPLSRNAVVENHVPPSSTFTQHPALAASKTILSRVGINIGGADAAPPPAGSSFVASALRMAAVDSAIAGGGSAAMAVRSAHPQKVDANGSASKAAAAADHGPTSNRNTTATTQQHATTTNKKQSSVDEIDHAEVSRFSTLLSPTVIDDHFDQYLTPTTARQPPSAFNRDRRAAGASTTATTASGRPGGGPPDDGSTMPTFSYDNPRQSGSSASPSDDRPPADEQQRNRTLLQRRKTLPTSPHPSLVVGGVAVGNPGTAAAPTPTPPKQPTPAVAAPTAASRAVAAPFPASAASAAAPTLRLAPMRQQALPVPSLYRRPVADGGMLRKAAGSNMGSMPDVSGVAASTSSLMPREEVHVLSQRRREELRRMREEAERRQQQDIVLRLGDIKEWCQERQMLVLLIALNISLATMFFNLLSH